MSEEVRHALGGHPPTEQQWAAISAPLEPSVLIAGAGSGKTAVMAARMVWLIVNGHANANEILGLTFTNKAAEQLLARVRRAIALLGLPEGEEPTIATYHSFASSLIADYGLRAGIEPGAALLSEAQAWQLCAGLYTARTYEAMEVRSLWHVSWVRSLADDCANHLVEPEAIIEHDREFLGKIKESGDKIAFKVRDTSRKRIEMAAVVRAYQQAKDARNVIDFGDQIRLAAEIARDEQVVGDFLARYRFALLDEYQDTNVAQAIMLRRLMPAGYPVMAVGDPDQNIYAWRGASLHNLLAFASQFPRADGTPATVLPLEVNFRSGKRILDLANVLIEGIDEKRRPPGKVLRHHPALGEGAVAVALVGDQYAEADLVADEAVRAHAEGTPWGEMAILCRKKRLFGGMVEVFRAREIPLEVIGLGGLLRMPEVVDLVSLLRVLDDPMRNVSLARLLRGPRWRIGHRDLALIARHAAERNRGLKEQMEVDSPGDVAFSLAEALRALDEVENVSTEARARITEFNELLAGLRADTHLPLPEFAARAVRALGIVRELDASPSAAAPSAKRNLANFLDRIGAFRPLDGEPTLSALIDWLDAVDEADEDIEAAQPTEADAVKLMTIHQAKGLEFDVVFVPGLARGDRAKIFPDTDRQANPATSWRFMPFELRGDREVLPKFMGNLSGFTGELKERAMEEERRLLYVAVTRARKRLVCSAAHWYEPGGMGEALTNPMGPSDFYREIAAFPEVDTLAEVALPEENPLIERRAKRGRTWPAEARRPADELFPDVAAAVSEARAGTTVDPTLFPLDALTELQATPRALAVSSVVTYARCPKQFYWSYVRPLPRRSSAAARIGTVVHAWIEQHGKGQIPLYDPEEYEERAPGEQSTKVAELKATFKRSRFADVTPVSSEAPFSLVVGEFLVHGRIDAIYPAGEDAWEIVDFKTGRPPEEIGGPERWQLDLYALAAQEIWGKEPGDVKLTFLYLGDGAAVERSFEARAAEQIRKDLLVALEAIAAGSFEPVPGPVCRSCDFRRHCAPGTAFLAT